jgi:5-enolpyruvylshikimate-3-phosphate synthase
MYISPKNNIKNSYINSYNDHRIAMSISIAALFIKEDILINNIECINKSFPTFFNTLTGK